MHRPTVRHAACHADEGKVSWLELFYDLAFVAVIGMVGHVLVEPDSDYRILGQFLLFFIPVWWAWVGQAFYLSRFQHDALSSRVTTLAQMIVLVVMAMGFERLLLTGSSQTKPELSLPSPLR